MKFESFIAQTSRCVLGAVPVLFAAACGSSIPAVPVEKAFGLGQGGESVEFEFRVKKTYGHVVNLDIYFHNSSDLLERKALIDQLGERIFADGTVGDVGVHITLRVRVKSIEVQGPPLDFDQTTDKLGFINASKNHASKRVLQIGNQKLQPGTYHIRVDNLHPVPEFADRKVRVALHHANQGK